QEQGHRRAEANGEGQERQGLPDGGASVGDAEEGNAEEADEQDGEVLDEAREQGVHCRDGHAPWAARDGLESARSMEPEEMAVDEAVGQEEQGRREEQADEELRAPDREPPPAPRREPGGR